MTKRLPLPRMLLGLSVALAATTAQGGTITGLYTTGVDGSGNVLGPSVADPHYVVVSTGNQAITMSSIPGSYIPNDSTSLWIWENADGQPTNVTRTFRTTFDLTGFIPSTASIIGTWATDNFGLDILINGVSTGQTSGGFSSYTNFSITSGFVAGVNTIDFVVQDVGVISGFRVGSLSGTASATGVPEPAGLLSAIVGVGAALGFAGAGRKRRPTASLDERR